MKIRVDSMTPSDYHKVKELFHSAVELPPEDRSAFLNERCHGNNELRSEVERLINSLDDEFLETPAVDPISGPGPGSRSRSGQRIGHYEVIRKIGSGGMGEVYLAVDGKLGRQVAVKILPDDFTADESRLDRFRLEARAASSLSHPNILTIFEVGEWEGTHYIATEYVDGETLRQRLTRDRLSMAEAMDLGIQLALGITAAHEASICHRDIKPENIMIRRDGLLKVVDFGLAKLVASPFRPSMSPVHNDGPTVKIVNTEPGVIMGTVQYMSPEQTRGLPTDERSDIWSIGCVLYEMLTGHAPFKGDTSADMVAEIVKSHPELPSRVVSDIPERLDEIIGKLLEKDPDERYQTAKDLLIDLKRLKRNLELEDVLERSQPRITTDSGEAVISGPNIISTRKGPKDLTEVNSAQYLYWGMKAHRWTTVGITLFIIGLVGGTALLVRQYWREQDPNERRLAYANKIKMAAQALEASNLDYAKQLLDESRPKKGQEDLRSFEWGYLARLHSERAASKPITIEQAGSEGVAFSPDGRSIATAGTDGTVRIWDVATGEEEMPRRKGHVGSVWSVAFSFGQNILLSSGADNTVRMWAANGQEKYALGDATDPVQTPFFAPDGRSFAAVNGDRIRFWDAATGTETRAIRTHGGDMLFAYSPDGKYLCIRGPDFTSLIIDREKDRIVSTLKGHAGFWTDAEFTPDSLQVLTGNTDGTVKLWDVETGRDLRTYKGHPGDIHEVALSPDGKTVAGGGKGNSITLWDRETGYEIATLKSHTGDVSAIGFSPNGLKLASSGNDNTTRIWNVPTAETRGVLRGHTSYVKSIAFSRDSKLIASGGDDKTAKIWDVATERQMQTIPVSYEDLHSVDFSPDSRTLVTGSQDQQVRLWDVVTGRAIRKFDSLSKGTAAFFSPDGNTIATTHFFNHPDVRIWNAASGKLVCSFRPNEGEDESVWGVTFAKDGRTITAKVAKNVIGQWDAKTCELVWKFEGSGDQDFGTVFAPGDKLIGIEPLNGRRSLRLFDPRTGKDIASIRGHDTEISTLSLSPDGKRLATASGDGLIIIWDVITGQDVLSMRAGPSGDFQAVFSPDGKTLATSGKDSTIRLWRADSLDE